MTTWTVAHQAPLSIGFTRQEYQSGLPFPSPEDLPNPGTESMFTALAGRSFTTEPPGKPIQYSSLMIDLFFLIFSSVQFSSVAQLCPTLCNPMSHSTPGLPVHHQLSFSQTHVHRVGDAIQPSHALPSPSPPAPNPSQPQGLFQ